MSTKQKKAIKSDSKARAASAAVFFNDNKSIAGFGNPLRAVFTSVRELVENALDASEKRNITPLISMQLRKMSLSEVGDLMEIEISKLSNKKLDFLELSCKDNGVGVRRELIPTLFGTVLAGTKYGAQQTRGRFGLGSKMVLLYSMSTLDLPIQITTRPLGEDVTYRVKLLIDLEKNQPIIVSDEQFREGDKEFFDEFGTDIKVSFTGNWGQAKNYVREYFKQLAIITPYADMHIFLPSDTAGLDDEFFFKRVVDELPKPPEVVPVHPWGADITTFRREIVSAEPGQNVLDFLVTHFMGVTEQAAELFFEEVGVDSSKLPSELTDKEIRRIVHDGFQRALRESKEIKRKRDRVFKFDDPKGDALSPLGTTRLRKGIEKELEPVFVEAVSRPPRAYEGHPFVIEAALGYGGGVSSAVNSKGVTVVDNKIIYRYANRIPLIFGAGNDVITQVVNSIKWNEYGLTRQTDPLAIAVSLVSTKIPFPETSKEYIDKVDEIAEEVKLALLQLGRKLKSFLSRSRRKQRERQRRSRFELYAPKTVENLINLLERGGVWNTKTGLKPSRVIAALSSGEARIARFSKPQTKHVLIEPIWSDVDVINNLQKSGILTVEEFLTERNEKLSKILNLDISQIDEIKRRTIVIFDDFKKIKPIVTQVFLNPEIEKRFHSRDLSLNLLHLSKALPRKWIRNVWDYLVTPDEYLLRIQGLLPKIFEEKRLEIIQHILEYTNRDNTSGDLQLSKEELMGLEKFLEINLEDPEKTSKSTSIPEAINPKLREEITESLTADKIKLDFFLPTVEEILEYPEVKKRKITSYVEFLIETTNPSSPITYDSLNQLIIDNFKNGILKLIEKNPDLKDLRIDQNQKWTDGYTKNSFKRRKLSKLGDVLGATDELLLEMSELLRLIFTRIIDKLKEVKTDLGKFKEVDEETMVYVPLFKKEGISSLEELALTQSLDYCAKLNANSKLTIALFNSTKAKIIDQLVSQNDVKSLYELKIINQDLESYLIKHDLLSLSEFLALPIDKFPSEIRDHVRRAKSFKTVFKGLKSSEIKLLNKIGVSTLEEFYFNFDYFIGNAKDEKDVKKLEKLYSNMLLPINTVSEELIQHLPILLDAGINTVGKLLIWDTDELEIITNLSGEWFDLILDGISLSSLNKVNNKQTDYNDFTNVISKEDIIALEKLGFKSLNQLITTLWNDELPNSLTNGNIYDHKTLNHTLFSPLGVLVDNLKVSKSEEKSLKSALKNLEDGGVVLLFDFMSSSIPKLTKLVSNKKGSGLIEELYLNLKQNNFPEGLIEPTLSGIRVFNLKENLSKSLIHLSEFSTVEVDLLQNHHIKTVYQLFLTSATKISKVLGQSLKNINEKLSKSTFRNFGTPLVKLEGKKYSPIFTFDYEGISHFSNSEIDSLIDSGYDTIETLYYLTNAKNFEVVGLSWSIINHMKSLLRSPSVLLSWKEEYEVTTKIPREESELDNDLIPENSENSNDGDPVDSEGVDSGEETVTTKKFRYVTLTSDELKSLSLAKLTRVFDFLTQPSEVISKILDWTEEKTRERQTTAFLQEVGIELENLNLFRPSHISHLNSMNYITVEDLYFSSFEESWDSNLIPWEAIKAIKSILRLPINFVENDLGEDVVSLLNANGVNTIIDFLLTGDPILEQKTGLPAERYENLKHVLEFEELVGQFYKSVYFIPGLTYFETQKLITNGIHTILDFFETSNKKLAKTLTLSEKDVRGIKDLVSIESVTQKESENGIPLKDINVFNRTELKTIEKATIFEISQIDTLQELYYQINTSNFLGEGYLLDIINSVQEVLNLPLEVFQTISEGDLSLLHEFHVNNLVDLLFVSNEDLPSPTPEIDALLTLLTKKFIDLKPLIAMSKIPAIAGSNEEIDGTLLERWKENSPALNHEVLYRIRSFLSLELKNTPFVNVLDQEISDDLSELTVADLVLLYDNTEEGTISIIQSLLKQKGALIELVKTGTTPITILNLTPEQFRSLYNAGITTVEGAILNDPKELSLISGLTQKFFRELKDNFDTTELNELLERKGLSVDQFVFDSSLKFDNVKFLDETVTVLTTQNPNIRELKLFLFSSNVFLHGYANDLQDTINLGARTIIESILAFRMMDYELDIIRDILLVGWKTYLENQLPLEISLNTPSSVGITNLQNFKMWVDLKPSRKTNLPKKGKLLYETLCESPLLLDLPGALLHLATTKYSCSTVLELLTDPFLRPLLPKGFVDTFLKNPTIQTELELPLEFIRTVSLSLFRRVESEKVNVQTILSSPHRLDTYLGIKQNNLKAVREGLKIPLTMLSINNRSLSVPIPILWLDELIHYLSELKDLMSKDEFNIFWHELQSNLVVHDELNLPENSIDEISTQLATHVTGFHHLWNYSIERSMSIMKTNSQPTFPIQRIIKNSYNLISGLSSIEETELWELWKSGIISINDLLLAPAELFTNTSISKKRIKQLQDIALSFVINVDSEEISNYDDLYSEESLEFLEDPLHTLPKLFIRRSHPLVNIDFELKNIHFLLVTHILDTTLRDILTLNEIKALLKKSIFEIVDFLMFPKSLVDFSERLSNYQDRVNLIIHNHRKVQSLLKVSDLNLPKSMKSFIDLSQPLSNLMEKVGSGKLGSKQRIFFTSVKLLKLFDQDKLDELNISSIFDLLVSSPKAITEVLNISTEELKEKIKSINFVEIEKLTSIDNLQINNIQSISDKGKERLTALNIYSLIDLGSEIPQVLSKPDQNILKQYKDLLNSPALLLNYSQKIRKLLEKAKIEPEGTIIEFLQGLQSKEVSTTLSPLDLDEILSNLPRLNILPEIRTQEEKILNSNGIFLFTQLLETNSNQLIEMGIEEERINSIKSQLSQSADLILNNDVFSQKPTSNVKVSVFLDKYFSKHDPITTPIIVQRSMLVEDTIQEHNLVEFLKSNKVETMNELINEETLQRLQKSDKLKTCDILSLLHLPLNKIINFPEKWSKDLREIGITTYWQLHTESEEEMINTLGVSAKSFSDKRGEFKVEFATNNNKFVSNLLKSELKLFSLSLFDFKILSIYPNIPKSLSNTFKPVSHLKSFLNSKLWAAKFYWELPQLQRVEILKLFTGDTLGDISEDNLKGSMFENLVNEWDINDYLTDLHDFSSLTVPKQIKSELNASSIKTVEEFMYNYYLNNSISENLNLTRETLRSSILSIPELELDDIQKLVQQGITHVSDVILSKVIHDSNDFPLLKNLDLNKLVNTKNLFYIGYFPQNSFDSLKNSYFTSWIQLTTNVLAADFSGLQGITENTFSQSEKLKDIYLWESQTLRSLGLKSIKALLRKKIKTLYDILISPPDALFKDFKVNNLEEFESVTAEISRADINRARKEDITPLNVVRKIRAMDIEELNKQGIKSVIQVYINDFKLPKNSPFTEGILSLQRLLATDIEEAKLPSEAKKKLKKSKIKSFGDFLFAPNVDIKQFSNLTNKEISNFRLKLEKEKKKTSKPTTKPGKKNKSKGGK